MSVDGYPLPAFHFRVSLANGAGADASFADVSGLVSTVETESYVEGGENRFVHTLPKGVSHSNLVLKRGIATLASPLVRWCRDVIEGGFAKPVAPTQVLVMLMDETAVPSRTWSLSGAWPVRWEVDGFRSTKNEVAIETIELAYASLVREL